MYFNYCYRKGVEVEFAVAHPTSPFPFHEEHTRPFMFHFQTPSFFFGEKCASLRWQRDAGLASCIRAFLEAWDGERWRGGEGVYKVSASGGDVSKMSGEGVSDVWEGSSLGGYIFKRGVGKGYVTWKPCRVSSLMCGVGWGVGCVFITGVCCSDRCFLQEYECLDPGKGVFEGRLGCCHPSLCCQLSAAPRIPLDSRNRQSP